MNMLSLSIIIPTFNSAKTLGACLDSILAQTFLDYEVWVVDGLSDDTTIDIVQKYQSSHPAINYVSEKDSGIYDAMNTGIDLAKGEWLYFLGSDDILFNDNVLANVFNIMNTSLYKVIYGNVMFKQSQIIYNGKYSFYKLNDSNICHQAIFFRKDLFSIIGKYEVRYKAVADWAFNIRWFGLKHKHKYIDEIVALYNEGGYSYLNKDLKFIKDKDNLIRQNFPIGARMVLHFRYVRFIGRVARFIISKLY